MTESDYERGYRDGKAEGRMRAKCELNRLLEQAYYLAKHIAELTEPTAMAMRREREVEPVSVRMSGPVGGVLEYDAPEQIADMFGIALDRSDAG